MSDPLRFRQSRLRSFVVCPRRTVLDTGWTGGTVGATADLGSAFHAVAAEILRTLWRQGEPCMATQEAVEVMREIMAAGPWVLGPGDGTASSSGYDMLVQMVLAFAGQEWKPERILAIEQRLAHEIVGPDGVARLATGTPDVVIADPPHTLILVDHKTGMARPPTPNVVPEHEPIRGLQYMSGGADFQLVDYGLLSLKQWPRVQTVILREKNWRWGGPWREAVMTRADLEHAEPYLGELMMKLERAQARGEDSVLARPRAGGHCTTRCPVARSCQIPREQRGLGVLETAEDAAAEAERWTVIGALYKQMRLSLKQYYLDHGEPIPVGDGTALSWGGGAGNAFEVVHVPSGVNGNGAEQKGVVA